MCRAPKAQAVSPTQSTTSRPTCGTGQHQRRAANDQQGSVIDQVNHRCAYIRSAPRPQPIYTREFYVLPLMRINSPRGSRTMKHASVFSTDQGGWSARLRHGDCWRQGAELLLFPPLLLDKFWLHRRLHRFQHRRRPAFGDHRLPTLLDRLVAHHGLRFRSCDCIDLDRHDLAELWDKMPGLVNGRPFEVTSEPAVAIPLWHLSARRLAGDFAQSLIGTARRLYADEALGLDLKDTVYALERGPHQILMRIMTALPGDEVYGYLPHDCSEDLIKAVVGFFSNMSVSGPILDRPVIYTPLPLPSIYCAVNGAVAAVSALVDRLRTGLGREIIASRLAGGLSAIGALSMTSTAAIARRRLPGAHSGTSPRCRCRPVRNWPTAIATPLRVLSASRSARIVAFEEDPVPIPTT